MKTDREKIKKFVENWGGRYIAPDGMVKSTNVATAEFDTDEEALIFIEELNRLQVSSSSNFLDFDSKIVYFLEDRLGKRLLN